MHTLSVGVTLIFYEATHRDIQEYVSSLNTYLQASTQRIKKHKSRLYSNIDQVSFDFLHAKEIGLPTSAWWLLLVFGHQERI